MCLLLADNKIVIADMLAFVKNEFLLVILPSWTKSREHVKE